MNNQKHPSGWPSVGLTSVKTSPSLSAAELHLQRRRDAVKRSSGETGTWFSSQGSQWQNK